MSDTFKWTRRSPGPNLSYEVSSVGDKRFSAFFARLSDGRSIEQHYQCDIKGYDPGGTNWRLGKGKPPLNRQDVYWDYLFLWCLFFDENPKLLVEIYNLAKQNNNTLSDCFASSDVNQARAIADVLNMYEKMEDF